MMNCTKLMLNLHNLTGTHFLAMIVSVLFYIIFFSFTLVFFVIFSVVFLLTVPFDRKRTVMHRMSRFWSKCYFALVPTWKVELEGVENIDPSQTYVVIVNHRSMIDIILMYVLPLEFKWVAKKEIYRWPLFGWVMRMHGDIGIERGSSMGVKKMMEDGQKWLSRGVSLIVFPEGSRSKTGEINRFKEGAFKMAKQAGVPILPCVIHGTGSATDGWKLNLKNVYSVRVLEPVSAEEVQRTDVKELAQRMHDLIERHHEELKKK